ncbi:MAG: GGDEF domain-containing protein [Alphaproteobacteria bacterium]|nr:GGDEF domain-containing protein [Alphaproteobacteria bacterium]
MRRLSMIDPLTGALSRRHFTDVGTREVRRSIRYGAPLSVLLADIDRFKKINDTLGLATGDAVLKRFAQTCRGALRKHDVIGRIGGEEFGILLPHTDAVQAL